MKSVVVGRGRPIFLLHEWLGDHRNWLPMIEHFSTDEFSFHCLDLPGYGVSQDIAFNPSIEAISQMVLDYALERKIEKFTLIAHSMSGLIGHHLGTVASQSLDDLVFFCPVPPSGFKATENSIATMYSVTTDRDALRQAIFARGTEFETEQWLAEKVDLAWSASPPEIKQSYLNLFLAPVSPEAQNSSVRQAKIICGDLDLAFYRKASLREEFHPFYDKTTIVSLDRCGHYPMLQKPALAADSLRHYLQQQD